MATDYLLPCSACGRTHRVSRRQAGGSVDCSCGATVSVPTMREMSQLEPAAEAVAVRHKEWGLRQRLWFIGSIIAGGGLAASMYFALVAMPTGMEFDMPQEMIQTIPPEAAWRYWTLVRHGMPQGMPPEAAKLVHEQRNAQRGLNIGLIAMVVGGVITSTGFMAPRTKFRPTGD
jgi:hypothetical protein